MTLRKAALFITDCCNLRCDYCYERNNEGRTIELSCAVKAVDFLISHSAESFALSFFGGEPLLHMDIIEHLMGYSVARARENQRKIHFLVNTNGTLLDRDTLTVLGKHRVMIVLSLDGHRDSHNRHRHTAGGGDSFGLIERNLEHILRYPSLHVRMTVTPGTVSRMHENVLFIKSLGFSTLGFALNRDSDGWGEEALGDLEKQYDMIADWYSEELRRDNPLRLVDIDLFVAKGHRTLKHGRPPCSAADGSMAVGPEGEIYPCHRFCGMTEAIIGDIHRGIDPEKAAYFRDFDPYAVRDCEGCPLLPECYKCIWLSFVKTGALSARIPAFCRESHIFIGAARKVASSLEH